MIDFDHKKSILPPMKVSRMVVDARRQQMARVLETHGYLPVGDLCERFGISEPTARRDLNALAKARSIRRTHGGALAEFSESFFSFNERARCAQNAKGRIARAAVQRIRPGGIYFFDTGTTVLAIARQLSAMPGMKLTVVTNNIPVAETLGEERDLQVYLLGGRFFTRQAALLGAEAKKSLRKWRFDGAFLSAEGLTAKGAWNSQIDIVQFQNAVLAHTKKSYLCIDAHKLGRQAPQFLFSFSKISHIITDAPAAALKAAEISLTGNKLITAPSR